MSIINNNFINDKKIILMTLDCKSRIIDINHYGCEILEIEEDKILGKKWIEEFLPETNKTEIINLFKKTIQGIKSDFYINENTILTAKKNEKSIKWYNQILRDANNKIIGVRCAGEDITDLHNIHNALIKSKTLFKGLIDTIADGIIIISKTGTILYINKATEKLFGKSRNELLGEDFGFPIFKETATEINIYNKEQIRIIAEIRVAKSEWDGDVCYIASLRDITERKTAEKRQKLTTSIFKILNEYGDKKIIIAKIIECICSHITIDTAGVRLAENRDFSYFYYKGISSEILKKEKYVFEHNGDKTLVYNQDGKPISSCLCGNILLNNIDPSHSCFTPSGSFWSSNLLLTLSQLKEEDQIFCARGLCEKLGYQSLTLIPLRSGDETIGLLQLCSKKKDIFTLEDIIFLESISNSISITLKRIITEEHLQESEKRFRNFFEKSPNYCFMISKSGFILDVNTVTLNNLGYSENDLVGKKFYNIYQKRYRNRVKEILHNDKLSIIENEELEILTKKNEIKTILLNMSPVMSRHGEYLYIIAQHTDITELKLMEHKFLHAQKMEAIGTLAGGIAHDFNNILTIIKSYSEFLMDIMGEGHEYHGDILEIHEATCKATALTRQLLAFSRKQILQPQELDINFLIENLSKMLRRIIGEDIRLDLVLNSSIPKIKIDPGQMEQVIMNLAVNSRDAMKNGGVFTITTKIINADDLNLIQYPELNQDSYVLLQIEDSGTGIAIEKIKHIFDPFYTTKAPGKGTGLGLSVAYGIIRQHKGWIIVSSTPGEGTIFKIYLPAVLKDTDNETIPNNTDFSKAIIRGNNEKILLVEDDDKIRNFIAEKLRNSNYEVYEAGSAEDALSAFKKKRSTIDIVFCDIVLPGMSGFDLIDELRKEKNNHFKILLTSGHSDEKANMQEILQRKLHFITKPYSVLELLSAIKSLTI